MYACVCNYLPLYDKNKEVCIDSIQVFLVIFNILALRYRPNCPVAVLILFVFRTHSHSIRPAYPGSYHPFAGMPQGKTRFQVVDCKSSHTVRRNWMRNEYCLPNTTGTRDSRSMPVRTRLIWSALHIAGWDRNPHGIPAERWRSSARRACLWLEWRNQNYR